MSDEWYAKHAKDVTTALQKAKTAKVEEALACTLVKTGDGGHLLCLGVSESKTAALVKEARGHGGKVVSAGKLYKGEDGLTFAVSDGSLAVKKQFSTAAATATGSAVNVIILGAPGLTAEPTPVPDTAETKPATQIPDTGAAVKARIKQLALALNGAAPEIQKSLKPLLLQALSLSQANRFAEAEPLLGQIEAGLKPPAPAPPPPDAVSDKTRLLERMREVKPRFLETMQNNPPNKVVLDKAMAALLQSIKEGNLAKGLKLLDGLEKALPDQKNRLAKSRERWLAARELVGKGISQLQAVLRNEPDPRAKPIAEMGLNGITGKIQVGLEVALQECESNPAARPKALQLIAKFRQFLTSDPRIALCDDNPFDIQVGLRERLLPALTDLEKVLAS